MSQWSIQVGNRVTFFEAPFESQVSLDGAILATDPGVYYKLRAMDVEEEGQPRFYKRIVCLFKGHDYRLVYPDANAIIACERCGKRRPDPA